MTALFMIAAGVVILTVLGLTTLGFVRHSAHMRRRGDLLALYAQLKAAAQAGDIARCDQLEAEIRDIEFLLEGESEGSDSGWSSPDQHS